MAGFWSGLWEKIAGRDNAKVSGPVEGFIGRKLKDLDTTHDFFRFFHFEPIGVDTRYDDGEVVMAYKPGGPAFRELVTLYTWISRRGVIQTIRLTVKRSFIDNPATCMNAADLYNTFLRNVGDLRYVDPVHSFAREIQARSIARSGRPVIMRGEPPRVEGEPSEAYRAYSGEVPAANLVYPSLKLKLVARNNREAGEFEILVWATDEEERERARKDAV
jgi:hypothetical protein